MAVGTKQTLSVTSNCSPSWHLLLLLPLLVLLLITNEGATATCQIECAADPPSSLASMIPSGVSYQDFCTNAKYCTCSCSNPCPPTTTNNFPCWPTEVIYQFCNVGCHEGCKCVINPQAQAAAVEQNNKMGAKN